METTTSDHSSSTHSARHPLLENASRYKKRTRAKVSRFHARIPYLRKLPLAAILIIALLVFVNLLVWAICGTILAFHSDTHLLGTAALAYSLGLRHALDADHITAIDLMTRRLIVTGQRPVTVGTFFSLGHSTIVVITSVVVAATAAGVSERFDGFSNVGGIIGTSVSAAFLILLGVMNAYILYRLYTQMQKIIQLKPEQEAAEAWNVQGGGFLFRVLKRMFKLIDRPWKMYPLGILFGLGFDTSSEIALLGISSIQGASGTSIWLILIFPVLFTSGMCLVDTTDGALMMSLYVAPMGMSGDDTKPLQPPTYDEQQPDARNDDNQHDLIDLDTTDNQAQDVEIAPDGRPQLRAKVKDPLTFLYYSIVLTTLTVICAIVIGVIQLLTLILNTADVSGPFWDGVGKAGDNYEIIGGAICGAFIVVGGLSVVCYKPWRRGVGRRRALLRAQEADGHGEAVETVVTVHGTGGRDSVTERFVEGDAVEEGEVVDELVPVDGKSHAQKQHGAKQATASTTATAPNSEEGSSSRP